MFYLLIMVGLLFIPFLLIFYVFSSMIAEILGAPFVPTSFKHAKEALVRAKLQKGQYLIELGSGDGRVVRYAVKHYQLKGLGVEFQPLLILYSRLIAWLQKLSDVDFKQQNFYNTDLTKADILFLFLLPHTLKKLRPKILKECKKGVLIISHGFRIEEMEKKLVDKIDRDIFPTYFYKL